MFFVGFMLARRLTAWRFSRYFQRLLVCMLAVRAYGLSDWVVIKGDAHGIQVNIDGALI
jgi:hypothetical protein